jgi:hypothetical protein
MKYWLWSKEQGLNASHILCEALKQEYETHMATPIELKKELKKVKKMQQHLEASLSGPDSSYSSFEEDLPDLINRVYSFGGLEVFCNMKGLVRHWSKKYNITPEELIGKITEVIE